MHSFTELSDLFEKRFNKRHFPANPSSLYDAAQYILQLGGKRIRPVSVLMGNELFDDLNEDAFHAAAAVELFHNFSLIHDDIMDKAPMRRGMPTVHHKFGDSTALLAGDVMFTVAYENLNKISPVNLQKVLFLFNKTSKEVCEGQQLDMDFEKLPTVSMDQYLEMITLKTSVLLAASLQLGAIIGGAGEGNQLHLYEFGKNLGIAFQVQDDYLDAFGDPEKFGKQVGGDILANKKTFLMIHVLEVATAAQLAELNELTKSNDSVKVKKVINIFRACGVDAWADALKEKYYNEAIKHLETIAVLTSRKSQLADLAQYLLQRDK